MDTTAIVVIIITTLLTTAAISGFVWFLFSKTLEKDFTLKNIQSIFNKHVEKAKFSSAINELKKINASHLELSVADGHETFFSRAGKQLTSQAKYSAIAVSEQVDLEALKEAIKARNSGMIDFKTFCQQAAKSGVNYWQVQVEGLSCTYFSLANKVIHSETYTDQNIFY
ncbi:hypothetical protein DTO96_100577 [Ephemeroptericola cinctiostellae]|uniref:DUF1398 domain-containing protein n=1 Tax=Ephemeroptericola cinctiostellae TaxID=2268024 RepID=A0A345D928_9BURK|nr:DUF1398 family protein [Ephemeroptericola cinctiostellae]AXF84866.1 hypothetical protein DTO96_100577 [Ephemeroptericola cinctiostellae]